MLLTQSGFVHAARRGTCLSPINFRFDAEVMARVAILVGIQNLCTNRSSGVQKLT